MAKILIPETNRYRDLITFTLRCRTRGDPNRKQEEAWQTAPEIPDLILMDVRMPHDRLQPASRSK
jgi:CheY-like chemotaxis protein